MLRHRDRHVPVDPQPGLAPWVGGKRNLARAIVERLERVPHVCYAEPFLGMGGVFFRRRRRPPVEVINDINADVVNLFRVVRHHPDALLEEYRSGVFARAEFDRQLVVEPTTLTDVQRAARFLFLMRARYGGLPRNKSFPATPMRSKALPADQLVRQVLRAHRRLETVTIERLPYGEFIERYDRPSTLFYLDPPYWGCENHYGRGIFERADFVRLAALLRGLKGRFVLSLNDRPEVRRLFRAFRIEAVEVTYRLRRAKTFPELIITGGRR